jgi:hypothetical protein
VIDKHEDHLASIQDEAWELIDRKYRAGQAEHGGDLWKLPKGELLDSAIDEAIDQVVYLLTLKQKMFRKG